MSLFFRIVLLVCGILFPVLAFAGDKEWSVVDEKEKEGSLESLFPSSEKPPKTRKESDKVLGTNMLILSGENLTGSCFFMKLGKETVIITNAHVFFEAINPVIRDVNGKIYTPREVFASKKRDLVILKIQDPEQVKSPLLLSDSVDQLQLRRRITAYGNSLGQNVVTILPGKLLGVGPIMIEVDCDIVPGNSGGPVIDNKTGKVLGVSTLLTTVKSNFLNHGTRFAGKRKAPAIRRFATRVDNVTPDELQLLTPEELRADQERLQTLSKFMDSLAQIADDSRNLQELRRNLQNYCFENSSILPELDSYEWKTGYLKTVFNEKRDQLKPVFAIFGIADPILSNKLQKAFSGAEIKEKGIIVPADTRPCENCQGTGKCKEKNPNYSRKRISEAEYVYIPCNRCTGTGKHVVEAERSYTVCEVPKEVQRKVASCIESSQKPFCGWFPGGKIKEELNRFSFYQNKLKRKMQNRYGVSYEFQGNHLLPNAEKTLLHFMFGRLVMIEICFAYKNPIPVQRKELQDYIDDAYNQEEDCFGVELVDRYSRHLTVTAIHEAFLALNQKDSGKISKLNF